MTIRRLIQNIIDGESPAELAAALGQNRGQGVAAEEVAERIMFKHGVAIQLLGPVLARQFILRRVKSRWNEQSA